ncbi:MAG: hypothetical protein IPK59_23080 [Rhodospirillaceae bacterium]|nr:hypothetical protein [Rhodospirillaceae bacterium]
MGSLVGALAAKAAMQRHGITGTIRFMGEPAEKVRGSKPSMRRRDMTASMPSSRFILLHAAIATPRWDTHCGPYYAAIYEFPLRRAADMASGRGNRCCRNPIPAAHTMARAPGANDAVVAMFTLSR